MSKSIVLVVHWEGSVVFHITNSCFICSLSLCIPEVIVLVVPCNGLAAVETKLVVLGVPCMDFVCLFISNTIMLVVPCKVSGACYINLKRVSCSLQGFCIIC